MSSSGGRSYDIGSSESDDDDGDTLALSKDREGEKDRKITGLETRVEELETLGKQQQKEINRLGEQTDALVAMMFRDVGKNDIGSNKKKGTDGVRAWCVLLSCSLKRECCLFFFVKISDKFPMVSEKLGPSGFELVDRVGKQVYHQMKWVDKRTLERTSTVKQLREKVRHVSGREKAHLLVELVRAITEKANQQRSYYKDRLVRGTIGEIALMSPVGERCCW